MSWNVDGARDYFDHAADWWHSRYAHKSRLADGFNRVFRKGIFERWQLTFEHCGNISGANVLDVGCGTGEYGMEFVKRGASRVVGVDFAPAMIESARRRAAQTGVSDQCEFICADFSTLEPNEQFEIILAVGLFDYVKEPAPVLSKLCGLLRGRFLASFPSYNYLWAVQRKIRYDWLKRCPVYDYSSEELDRLYRDAGFTWWRIIPMSKGLFCVAENRQT